MVLGTSAVVYLYHSVICNCQSVKLSINVEELLYLNGWPASSRILEYRPTKSLFCTPEVNLGMSFTYSPRGEINSEAIM